MGPDKHPDTPKEQNNPVDLFHIFLESTYKETAPSKQTFCLSHAIRFSSYWHFNQVAKNTILAVHIGSACSPFPFSVVFRDSLQRWLPDQLKHFTLNLSKMERREISDWRSQRCSDRPRLANKTENCSSFSPAQLLSFASKGPEGHPGFGEVLVPVVLHVQVDLPPSGLLPQLQRNLAVKEKMGHWAVGLGIIQNLLIQCQF